MQVCEIYAGPHVTNECQVGISFIPQPSKQVNYVANQGGRQFNPNANIYNLGWKNHPNFSWSNNQNVLKPPIGFQLQEKKPLLEDLVATMAKTTSDYMAKTDTMFQNQQAAIRNLEMQIGQIANMVNNRAQGVLPRTTENNPKEKCKAIKLRSGKQVGQDEEEEAEPKEVGQNYPEIIDWAISDHDQNATESEKLKFED